MLFTIWKFLIKDSENGEKNERLCEIKYRENGRLKIIERWLVRVEIERWLVREEIERWLVL